MADLTARRRVADSMLDLIHGDDGLRALAYNMGFWMRTVAHPNNSWANYGNVTPGKWMNFSAPFWMDSDFDSGAPRYFYRPTGKGGHDGPDLPKIMFSDFTVSAIEDIEILPAVVTPVGAPTGTSYQLDNARPDPDEREFDRERFSEDQSEKSFGWLVSLEAEQSLKTHASFLGSGGEISAQLRERVEAHGDKRWTHTTSLREALRGRYAVSAWGRYERTLTEKLVEMSQQVLMTGRLECKISFLMDHKPTAEFGSFEELVNAWRGLGGSSWLAQYLSWTNPSIDKHWRCEQEVADKLEAHRPRVLLDVGPKDVRLLHVSDVQSEVPLPGHEAEYAKARGGGTDAALDRDLGTSPETYAPEGDWDYEGKEGEETDPDAKEESA